VPDEEIYPRQKYPIEQLQLINDDPVCAGDDISVLINLANEGIFNSDDVRISVTVPELALRRTVGPFSLAAGDDTNQRIDLTIPEYTDEGMYEVRVYIYSDSGDFHRIKHRDFIVKHCSSPLEWESTHPCQYEDFCGI
jgi:hypothetical protein